MRKLRKNSEAGLSRYWIIGPPGPEIVVFARNPRGRLVEVARHAGDEVAELDVGPVRLALDRRTCSPHTRARGRAAPPQRAGTQPRVTVQSTRSPGRTSGGPATRASRVPPAVSIV